MRLSYSRLQYLNNPRATPNHFYSDFSSFLRSRPDAFLTCHVFRHAARGNGLCSLCIRGLPPTPRSVHITERPRCASVEPGFQNLTTSLPYTSGEQACVQGQPAWCVGGRFVMTPCAACFQCFALPLVNKPGTR